ncbi:UDP-4-amino-4-deoxy-L-arabinose--oxoglutarate aminotransferase [uncultured archaeon]|nr:UDP-4-amino-4-deoxy-L-arabinose--oxoglutarate aminotransferase [uncultured archaeon]
MLKDFEKEIANFFGTEHAIVTGSGRIALQIALQSFELSEGNVIVPNLICSMVPQTIISTGLTPLLVDLNKDLSLNVDVLENEVNQNTKVLLVNYLYGCPTDDIKKLMIYLKDKNMLIIEDVAQAFGLKIKGKYAGTFGDFGILSFPKLFFPFFRGGAIITNDEKLARRAYSIRKKTQTKPNLFYIMAEYIYYRSMKHLPKVLKKRLTSINTTPRDSTKLYERKETSSPYHLQNLTNFETMIGIQTLHNLKRLIVSRQKIIEKIYSIILNSNNLHLKPLFPYRDDYLYFRIPVFVKNASIQKWRNSFYKQGEIINMIYRPLSNNTLLRHKCVLLKDYSNSEYLSANLLPLPVTPNVIKILKKLDTT